MRKITQIVFLIGILVVQFNCSMNSKSILCIKSTTTQNLGDSSYISLRTSLLNFIESQNVDSTNRIELEVGQNVLFNNAKTRALAISLSIYKKPNGQLIGYGTIYLADLQANKEWKFDRSNTPNFLLTINEDLNNYELDIQKLEDYVLNRLISDGLMGRDRCSINQEYINTRWN